MALKRLPEDFRDFLNFLGAHSVEYLLIGGWAVGIHGYPRATGDLDVLIAIDDSNLDRLIRALVDFGAPEVNRDNFKQKGSVFRMGRSPIKIDIVNEASGIEFYDCYARKKTVHVDGIDISLISKEDLIKNKMAAGRAKDLADVENLQEF